MANILLIEDDVHINNINKLALLREGYNAFCATSIKESLEVLKNKEIDLIVLDIGLPDGDGVSLCEEIKAKYDIPIIFLSAMGENNDIVKGLNSGADDYMSKPYDLAVLVARIKARLRVNTTVKSTITIGDLFIDGVNANVYYDGKDLFFTKREFMLFWVLLEQKGKIIDRDTLYEKVWGYTADGNYNSLHVLISRVKNKLSDAGSDILISSKRQEGYMLNT